MPNTLNPFQNEGTATLRVINPDRSSVALAFASYVLCSLAFLGFVVSGHNYWNVSRVSMDNVAYLSIARATLKGRFTGADMEQYRKFYRGTSYSIALVSKLTTLSVERCFSLMSITCGTLSLYLCGRLWGWRVATLFSFINVAYTEQICLGGCEPLFVMLLFSALWLWRKQRMLSAILCASFATTVRPTGIFLLIAFGIALLWDRRWRDFLRSIAVSVAIGLIYLLPMIFAAHDPSAPMNGYARDWYGVSPITVPFYPLLYAAIMSVEPLSNSLKNWFYIGLTIVGIWALWKRRHEAFEGSANRAESLFYIFFSGFCVSYNSVWAFLEYPRFSIPLVPQSLLGFRSRIFDSWWAVLPASVAAGILSAASALRELRPFLHMLHQHVAH